MAASRLLGRRDLVPDLHELRGRAVNFEPGPPEQFTAERGWTVDDYCRALPSEPPGPPVPNGSWESARELMVAYEFADPSIIRAAFDADASLEGRDMLLEARFLFLRFYIGVRVDGVRDETSEVDGRPVRLFGWSYRTLEGHFEVGQMDYEVRKWLDNGEIEFRIHRFVRSAHTGNLIVRLGFRVFGRRKQIRFAERACERMVALTTAALEGRFDAREHRNSLEGVAVRPDDAGAARRPS